METAEPRFAKHVFVCENEREAGRAACGAAGTRLRELLKSAVKARGWADRVRVARTGCLDVCEEGPNVLLMPDNIWFKKVSESDVPAILDRIAQKL